MTAQPQPDRHGRIVTVFAAKSGCGKTTFAANLAVTLNAGGTRRVCLVDLDLAYGDVASMLGLKPRRSLADAVGMRPLSTAAVSWLVTPMWPGLDTVLAPAMPGGASEVPSSLVGELLAALPAMYDYIVVDTPAQFSANVLAALDSSHHQVLLGTPELPALQHLRVTLDMLDLLLYPRQSRSVVLNRCDPRAGLTVTDIENTIKCPIAGRLPSTWDVPASINRGVPLASAKPDHRFSHALRRLVADHIVGPPADQDSGLTVEELQWGW